VYFKEEEKRSDIWSHVLYNKCTFVPDGRTRYLCCYLPIIRCAFSAQIDVGGANVSHRRSCLNHPKHYIKIHLELIQGGEDAQDALSCRSLSAKKPLILRALVRKRPMKIRHPMTLRHPVQKDWNGWTVRVEGF